MINKQNSKKYKIQNYLIMILMIIFLLEISSFVIIRIFFSKYAILYDKNQISQKYQDYLSKRDKNLGWDNMKINSDAIRLYDESISNLDDCVDVYGDSFTYGHDIPENSWPHLLSKNLNCEVRNFGVSGYGTDQSLIKFSKNKNHSKVVMLNHLSENIIRNLSQFRNLIYKSNEYTFKPKYIFKNDELKLIPLNKIPKKEINFFLKNPNNYLFFDYFIPNGPSGIQYLEFPYTLKLLKSFNHWQVKKKIRNIPLGYDDFYNFGHQSNGLEITYEIMINFYNKALSKGLKPILTVIPTCRDLEYYKKFKKFSYENLINLFKTSNVNYIDFGPVIYSRSENNINEFYSECSGHFNKEGEKLLSKIIQSYLVKNNFITLN